MKRHLSCLLLITSLTVANAQTIPGPGPIPGVTQTVGGWTPVDASGAGLTLSISTAGYTKTGNIVCAYARLTYPSTVDASLATIGGLPVAAANQTYARTPSSVQQNTVLAFSLTALPTINDTSFGIFNSFTGVQVANSVMSGATIFFNTCYPVR